MDNDLKFYHYFRHTFRINVSYTIEVNLYTRMYTSVLLNKYISCIVYVSFFLFLFWEIRKIHQPFFWNILPILIISFFLEKFCWYSLIFSFEKSQIPKFETAYCSIGALRARSITRAAVSRFQIPSSVRRRTIDQSPGFALSGTNRPMPS